VTTQIALNFEGTHKDSVGQVLDVIREHSGRNSAVSMHEIYRITGVNTRDIQAIVKYLVEEKSKPIGTRTARPFGYYIIEVEAELVENYQHFLRRGISCLKHARAYRSAAVIGPIVGQLEMELEQRD
jgi:hypothetical protein